MVITLDFESSDPGSNPGRTFFFILRSILVLKTEMARGVETEFVLSKNLAVSDWVAEWSKAPV